MASAEISDAQKIAELREKFKKKYVEPPSPKLEKFDERDLMRIWNDDLYALSFIHWKKEVINDAVEMVAQVLEWRKTNGVTDLSVEDIGVDIFKRGVVYTYGRGIDGSRTLALIGKLQTKDEKEKVRKVLTFWLERLQRNEPGKHVTFILDTHKTAMSNVDLGMIRYIIDAFTTYFPDLLERIIILDMPWIMNAIWNIVKQWMSEEQRSKTCFCSRKDLKKFIAADQLPKSLGGTVDWTYSFPPFPDDLNQNQSFTDDPMNFKIEEKPEVQNGTAPPPSGEEKQANGDVQREPPDDLNNNNNQETKKSISDLKIKKLMPEKKLKEPADIELPSTSQPTSFPPVSTGPEEDVVARTSTPISDLSKLVNPSAPDQDHREDQAESPSKEDPPKLKRHDTGDDLQETAKLPPNVSFKSLAPPEEIKNHFMTRPEENMKIEAATDEIVLGNLLVMSPVSELNFTLEGDRLEGYMNFRNPNGVTTDNDRKIFVAYKIKTTSPERYHVKPSLGVVAPGDSIRIRIYLSTGFESSMPKDRFLILYKPIVVNDDALPSYGEVAKFWKKNSDRSSHFEHRVRVKVEETKVTETKESKDDAKAMTPASATSPPPTRFFSLEESSPKVVEYAQLQHQIGLLNNKIMRLEGDSRWMRRRMRHTMGLLFVLIILIFLILYEVTMMSYKLSFASQSTCKTS